jgi:hypothetical protein
MLAEWPNRLAGQAFLNGTAKAPHHAQSWIWCFGKKKPGLPQALILG